MRTLRAASLLTALLLLALAAGIPAAAQAAPANGLVAPSEPLPASPSSTDGDQIFAELVRHNELRTAALREYSALRTYAVTDLNGKVHAKSTVRLDYVAPDKKIFATIREEGSAVIRHLVLNRLMENEVSAAAGQDHRDSSITPANYTFSLLGEEDLGGHHCFVVDAVPRRRDKYLFEGKVWIDSQDFAVVKIAGHPAKKLSFWINRADFVRQYEKVGDFWLPSRDETFVDVKLYGKKILSIEHHIGRVNGVTSSLARDPHDPASPGTSSSE
jgi:Outer membrane lipoprotein-sorting protein